MAKVSVSDAIVSVNGLTPGYGYKIREISAATGWSIRNIYNMMDSGLLKWYQQGAHRRVLGRIVKDVFFNKV